jgi:tetratricopeptide (TPR) repeat protein
MVLSLINHHVALMGFAADTTLAMEAAYALGRRATQLDDRNEYAHWAWGISCWGLHKHDESIVALERAVDLNPNCSLAYGSLGTLYGLVGRTDDAIANQQIAIRSNPRDPSIFFRFSGIALAYYLDAQYETAILWAERAINRMPRWFFGHFLLVASNAALGQHERAQEAVAACQIILPDLRARDLNRVPLKDATRMEEFRAHLLQAGFPN